jgi:hypothetical protein
MPAWGKVHSTTNLHVDKTVEDFHKEIVMHDDVVGEKRKLHLHILISIERHFEIHILDVRATELGSRGANHAIPHDFC